MKRKQKARKKIAKCRCPVCESLELVPFGQTFLIPVALPKGVDPSRNLMKCNQCGSISIDRMPSKDFLSQYYDNYSSMTGENSDRQANGDWSRRTVLSSIHQIAKKSEKGRVLDIGCGDGSLLDILPSTMDKYGVDMSEDACEQSRQKGIKVICGGFLSASFGCKFDMIIALDVLEHFPSPRQAIWNMVRILAPGGYLVIQTGNAHSLAARTLREDWFYTAVFGHLCVLTSSALREITAIEGLSEISLQTGMRIKTDWKTRIHRTCRAYGFHAYRRLYSLFEPIAEKYSFLYELNQHIPPTARYCDHMTYIGRKAQA